MTALVGYTGFVGSILYAAGGIDRAYNSKNIEEAYGTAPGLLVYAGLPAAKYLANHAPEKDMDVIRGAQRNIEAIGPQKLVLISTIDVFQAPSGVDEDTPVETEGLHPYGYNRYQLELWVRQHYPDALVVRLPGLFGANLKKNFLYDFMNPVPSMLTEAKLKELGERDGGIAGYSGGAQGGFCRLKALSGEEKARLGGKLKALGFTALNFTDSRSVYQFYPLYRLWGDIQTALSHGLTLWHPATEPVSAAQVYRYLTGEEFCNHLPGVPAAYDYRTRYAPLFGGRDGYICDKAAVLKEIKDYVSGEKG